MKDFSTLCELLLFQAKNFKNPQALNFKENGRWRHFSNEGFLEQAFYFACGLKEIGFQKNQTLAIFSYQNPIWLIVDFGTILAGGVSVPIFHNISQENLLYQIENSQANHVFSDNVEVSQLLGSKKCHIISYGFKGDIKFESLIALGRKAALEKKYDINNFVKEKKPDDLATIIYTSGSTAKPKGVELSHHNLVSQIKVTATCFNLNHKSDVALSFLPLAHVFERMVMMFYIAQGIKIIFVDDVKNIAGYLQETNPSLMTVVPRVLEKLYAKINEKIDNQNFIIKFFAKKAVKRALEKNPEDKNCDFYDKIFAQFFYKKFCGALGNKIRMIICGGALLSEDMERFYKNIGINLYCGYGLTESSPVLSANCQNASKFGTVGKAYPSVSLKIADDNELLAKGPNIMRGYHNDVKKTREIIVDGWLKTGDLAQIDEEGFIKIIGRKKELFKTSNGKYVRPNIIEQKLIQKFSFLNAAIVIAENRRFTSALLFVDLEALKNLKNKLKFNQNNDEFLKSTILDNYIKQTIHEINSHLDHAEQIQHFKLIDKAISIETGEITPSMKIKRHVIEEKFAKEIAEIYKE